MALELIRDLISIKRPGYWGKNWGVRGRGMSSSRIASRM